MEQKELVSILIASYNSANYILDLLESIKAQTYERLQLVVADDASKDNSVEVVKKWLSENEDCFEKVDLCLAKQNRGTSKNMNCGLSKCQGKYVKIIAADDMLMPECIEDCLNACEENGWEVVIGDVQRVEDDGKTFSNFKEDLEEKERFYGMNAEEQHKFLLKKNIVTAPSSFYLREFLERNNRFDETFVLIEDYPFWLKITSAGMKLNRLPKQTVLYRMSSTSVAHAEKPIQIYNPRTFADAKNIFYKLRFKQLWKAKEYAFALRNLRRFIVRDCVIKVGNNRKNLLCRLLVRFE